MTTYPVRSTTPPRQILRSLDPNTPPPKIGSIVEGVLACTPKKRSRSSTPVDEGISPEGLSELNGPARYHYAESMAHWSNKNHKGLRGKQVHTMTIGDSPEKEIKDIVEHVRAAANPLVQFDLPSGNQVQWTGRGFSVYSEGKKIREWGVHSTKDGRWISFPVNGRNLVVFKKDSPLTPAHLADWSQEVQQSGVDPMDFLRKKIFSPDGNRTQNTDGN